MDTAVRYIELMDTFRNELPQDTVITSGRRFDRVAFNGMVQYFVDKETWIIYGAKSAAQYNPRREYGTLETVNQFDWAWGAPWPGTALEQQITAREAAIAAGYKKRGRPRKTPAGTP